MYKITILWKFFMKQHIGVNQNECPPKAGNSNIFVPFNKAFLDQLRYSSYALNYIVHKMTLTFYVVHKMTLTSKLVSNSSRVIVKCTN